MQKSWTYAPSPENGKALPHPSDVPADMADHAAVRIWE